MSARFARTASRQLRAGLAAMGATFLEPAQHMSLAITTAGYRQAARYSIVERARQAGSLKIPRLLLNTLFRWLRDGYQVWVFELAPPTR